MAAKLLRKENADPAESLLAYTNKRPAKERLIIVITVEYERDHRWLPQFYTKTHLSIHQVLSNRKVSKHI